MFKPGDVVVTNFPGAVAAKRRPGVVISTSLYHTHRPDVIVGVLTTNIAQATAPTNYALQDWSAAGLHRPSAFRAYLITFQVTDLQQIGTLTEADRQGVQNALSKAVATAGDITP